MPVFNQTNLIHRRIGYESKWKRVLNFLKHMAIISDEVPKRVEYWR